MGEFVDKQMEVIESLVWFSKKLIDLLRQYINTEEYEYKLDRILHGDDVII